MNAKEQHELLEYLKSLLQLCRDLQMTLAHKKKTLKSNAAKTTLLHIVPRIQAKVDLLKNGGEDATITFGNIVIQKELYEPLITYWVKEIC